MKKILFCAFTVLVALSCSKNSGIDDSAAAGEGRYTLPTVSATLDDEADTRTSLGTNQVVNWTANDRIAIINTKTNTIYQYRLYSGQSSSVGYFEPVGAAAAYDDLSDLKAVYPAVAASVSGGEISFEINKDWPEADRLSHGITSWTADSPYAFTYNDIKVSYNTPEVSEDSDTPVNFKFRQLATWCTFTFDFSSSKYTRESMESMEVTTVGGTKKISGKAVVDFSNAMFPALKEGTETAVKWTFNAPLSFLTPVSRSLMLFPGIDNEQLKITVKTSFHTLTFYATPKHSLTAGTVFRFPIDVDKNFTEGDLMADFTYSVVEDESIKPFYYYGTSNCLIMAKGTSSGSFDVTPYKSNVYYERIDEAAPEAPQVASAGVIWKESTITSINATTSGNTLKLSNVSGSGNALVGIYDADQNLLWSYHIWCPEVDPTQGLLTYAVTNSGSYQVMPLALGATAIATPNDIRGIGLWYQWGRKDPMGRQSGFNVAKSAAVDVPGAKLTSSTSFFTSKDDGASNAKDICDLLASYDEETMGPRERYMIDYSIKNPTVFIYESSSTAAYNYSWTGSLNGNLWGNPQGTNDPKSSQLGPKSAFDPCPKGYRVAPRDLWLNFSTTGMTTTKFDEFNISNSEDGFTVGKGFYFYYEGNKNDGGKTDFYPFVGWRYHQNGQIGNITTYGFYWSSTLWNNGSVYACLFSYYGSPHLGIFDGDPTALGLQVRCVVDTVD